MRRRTIDIGDGGGTTSPVDVDVDVEAFSAAERATTDRRALVPMLIAHAACIAASSRSDAGELALRKATRAHLTSQELGDGDLIVEALRARVSIAQRLPGREELAAKLARDLVTLLHALPGETRRERALLLAGAWSKPWWWYAEARAVRREDVATDEAQHREALALLLDVGDDVADDVAFVAVELVQLLERCRALEAAMALRAELAKASSAIREACLRRGLTL